MAVGCVGGNRRRGRGFRIGRRRRVVTGRARRAAGEKGQQGERGDRFNRAILGGCGRWKKRLSLFPAQARSPTPPDRQSNTSELQSIMRNTYSGICMKKK